MFLREFKSDQRGTVMVAVLIIALAVAIFSYSLLISSLDSLERSDVQDYRVKAKMISEGGLEESAFAIKQTPDYIILPDNPNILPAWAGGKTDEEIKNELVSDSNTWQESVDALPDQSYRAAYSEYQLSTYESPDLYFIWGDTDNATIEYQDEYTYRRHFFDYHYNPYDQESDIIVGASGEVDSAEGNKVFSFGTRSYPSTITRFQTRANSAREQNELDPEPPYFQSEHNSYDTDLTPRYWTVSYDFDPDHPGRDIDRIDLIATPGEVSIGSGGDFIWSTGWNGVMFDPPSGGPPNFRNGPYTNATNLLTENIDSTTIRVGFRTDDIIDPAGLDYGYKLYGIRYFYNSDVYPARYETSHPYDNMPDTMADPAVQAVYSPYQAVPGSIGATAQMLRIKFDWRFFLEAGDTLEVWNLAGAPPYAIATLTGSSGAGQVFQATREDDTLPLAIGLFLYSDGDNFSSTNNYGYLVEEMEYTNEEGIWVTASAPYIETPHLGNLGTNEDPFDPDERLKYNYIYQPDVPGGGTLDHWEVHFDEACDLYATGPGDNDVIRITTPGYSPAGLGFGDVHYFVNPSNPNFGSPAYHSINLLKGLVYDCGKAPYMEIYCSIDAVDDYMPVTQNWGYRALAVSYSATDANDLVKGPPTIAAAVSRKPGEGYVNFGAGPDSRAEWWITEKEVETIGIHIDLDTFDLDLGDYLAIFDENANLVGTITARSYRSEGPDGTGPYDDDPGASGPDDQDADANPPENTPGYDEGTINLNETRGWVLVPGESAHIILVGDGDDNEGHYGFQVDRTAWWSGVVTYASLGEFEKLENKDVADYKFSGESEYIGIR